jgi:hypothetical protein
MNLLFDSTQVNDLFYYTNGSHEGFVKFCVIEVFKFWVRYRYEENKEWQDPKLGDAQGTPR